MRTVEWCDSCDGYHPAGEHTALVPCTCGAQMVRPYPNDTGIHSTTECLTSPGATPGGEGK